MAFTVTCDNPDCGAEIESGPGRAFSQARREVFCPRCAAMTESVEAQVRVEATEMALRLTEQIDQRRRELRAQFLAQQVFPTATAPEVPRGAPPRGEWLIQVPE